MNIFTQLIIAFLSLTAFLTFTAASLPVALASEGIKVTQPLKLLARAPAKRWDGLFSIRVNIKFGDKSLNGQFLIDSAAKRSIVSPFWLESQGINPALLLGNRRKKQRGNLPSKTPQTETLSSPLSWPLSWGGQWEMENPVARLIEVDQAEIGGLVLPFHEFLLAQTEFFGPPENASPCCDGVLGLDFLRLYPIEFQVEYPYEVKVWPQENFTRATEAASIEMIESELGLVSPCVTTPTLHTSNDTSKSKTSSTGKIPQLPGILWETGSSDALYVHTHWRKQVFSANKSNGRWPNQWSIYCAPLTLTQNASATFPLSPSGTFTSRLPAISIGMSLMDRGNFTFDIPHNKIWLSTTGLNTPAPRVNESGLSLQYVLSEEGSRKLKVMNIRPKSKAQTLRTAGLREGMFITQLNNKDPDTFDEWEVQRYLAGDHGNLLTFHWKIKNKELSATLNLAAEESSQMSGEGPAAEAKEEPVEVKR